MIFVYFHIQICDHLCVHRAYKQSQIESTKRNSKYTSFGYLLNLESSANKNYNEQQDKTSTQAQDKPSQSLPSRCGSFFLFFWGNPYMYINLPVTVAHL